MRKLTGCPLAALAAATPASAAMINVELRNPQLRHDLHGDGLCERACGQQPQSNTPLSAGSSRGLTVFNDYNKRAFTFTINFNTPKRAARRTARTPAKPFRVLRDIDICQLRRIDLR